MSVYYRKEQYREGLFLKYLHLKFKVKQIKKIESNLSFPKFIESFKLYYPCAWEDLVSYCNDKQKDYERRTAKGLRVVPYYSPEEFLKRHVNLRNSSKQLLPADEIQSFRAKLISKGRSQKAKREQTLSENLVFVQQVCPPYVQQLIKAYFLTRRTNALNINARYLILLEASQFKCDETIEFMHKISACERNHDLRMMAYEALRRMGEHPWLARNRKGKTRLTQIKPIDIKKNPTELLQLLYENQHALYQSYDVFLSHSSLDTMELLRLKAELNNQGKTVYIDWINDRVMLNRANQNEDTWNALKLRMDQSKSLLYVMTDNSIRSPYTKWEVEYFKKTNKPITVIQPYPISLPIPDYLEEYSVVE